MSFDGKFLLFFDIFYPKILTSMISVLISDKAALKALMLGELAAFASTINA